MHTRKPATWQFFSVFPLSTLIIFTGLKRECGILARERLCQNPQSINLPNQTLWINVPKGSILHIDELALYHLTDVEYQAEIEISPFFKQHSFALDPELEERIKEEGTQLIDLTPVDRALEAIAHLPPAGAPIIQSWSAADTAFCISTIVGYVVTLTLAFLLHKRQASERRSRVSQQMHVRHPTPFPTW